MTKPDIFHKIYKILFALHKSTVQTEQAINGYSICGAGSRVSDSRCKQHLWDSSLLILFRRCFLLHRKLRSVCNKKNSGGTHCGGKEDAACDSPPQAEIALSRNLSCTLAVNKATGFCVAAQPPVP